jgi:MoaA/NifB/PqqE/SkfB family radical SAM enzyme
VYGAAIMPGLRLAKRLGASLVRRGEELGRRLSYLDPTGRSLLGPKWLVLAINNTCNLHCSMCDVGTGDEDTTFYKNLIGDKSGDMPLDLYDRILDQASRFMPRPRLSFAYTEPGMHPNVVEMVARATRAGFYVSLTTNGITLPRLAEPLSRAGLKEIFVSLDGPAAIHDAIRGSPRSFGRAVGGIRELARLKATGQRVPRVVVGYVFTPQGYLSLVELIDQLSEAQARPDAMVASLLNFVHPTSSELQNSRFGSAFPATVTNLARVDLSSIDNGALADQIAAAERRATVLGIPLVVLPHLRSKQELDNFHREPTIPIAGDLCADPWNMMLLQTNGDVIPSHGRCFHSIAGNLKKQSLGEVWNGEELRRLRRLLKEEAGHLPACTRCCGVFDRKASGLERLGMRIQQSLRGDAVKRPTSRLPILS